jgi:hypothetical protein
VLVLRAREGVVDEYVEAGGVVRGVSDGEVGGADVGGALVSGGGDSVLGSYSGVGDVSDSVVEVKVGAHDGEVSSVPPDAMILALSKGFKVSVCNLLVTVVVVVVVVVMVMSSSSQSSWSVFAYTMLGSSLASTPVPGCGGYVSPTAVVTTVLSLSLR